MALFDDMTQEEVAAIPGFNEALANNPEFIAAIKAQQEAEAEALREERGYVHEGEGVFKGRTPDEIAEALKRAGYFESDDFAKAIEDQEAEDAAEEEEELPFGGVPQQPGGGYGGGAGAPSGEHYTGPVEWHGINSEMMGNQLQQLMAQRMRYYNNADPNLGGPALGQGPSDLNIPPTPNRQQEYIDPTTGQPIDINPALGFQAAPALVEGGGGVGSGGIMY